MKIKIILLDGFKYDYLSKEDTPFLWHLAEKHSLARLESILGFTTSISYSLFTGNYPNKHGVWCDYVLRRNDAQFNSPNRISMLLKTAMRYISKTRIGTPYSMSKYIEGVKYPPPLPLPATSFFKISDLDWVGHLFGPNHSFIRKYLRIVDKKVERLYSSKEITFILSDHGMSPVLSLIKPKKLNMSAPYLYESVMLRTWGYVEDAPTEHGHWLSETELRRLGLDFKHNLFGERIFLLDAGFTFYPNFISIIPYRGMHGYMPSHPDMLGILITNTSITRDKVHIADIKPTIYDLMGKSPSPCDGKSLAG